MQSASAFSSSTHSAEDVIAALKLEMLDQEGGYFRRTAESGVWVTPAPAAGDGAEKQLTRAYSVIYALFTPESFSALHRLATDEIWCWHAGDPLESLRLHPDGRSEWVKLGADVTLGQRPQDIVGASVWQGTRLVAGGSWALISCIIAPEFRWADFELGERAVLVAAYPPCEEGIRALTRNQPMVGVK